MADPARTAADSPARGTTVPDDAPAIAARATTPLSTAVASPPIHTRRAALALVVALALVWGIHWPVVKIGVGLMPPFTYGALRVATGWATLTAILLARGNLRRPPREDLSIVVAVGLGQIGAAIALINVGLLFVTAGRAAILVYTMPLWVALIGVTVLRVRPRTAELAGLALGCVGVLILLNPLTIDWGDSNVLVGTALLLVDAVLWAATTIHVRAHRWRASPLELQPWELLVALVPLGGLALVLEWGRPIEWNPGTIAVLAYSGPLATGFAYWASQSISRALTPLETTTSLLAVPVVGLIAGAIALGEGLTIPDVAGFTIVALGIVATSGPLTRRPASVSPVAEAAFASPGAAPRSASRPGD